MTSRSYSDGDCRIWDGAKGGRAGQYGKMWDPRLRRVDYVHRIAYRAFVGPIPDGYEVDHTCLRTLCLNPQHLEAVTGAENLRRRDEVNARMMCPKGHSYSLGNVYFQGNTKTCKQCHSDRERARRQRLRNL